MVLYKHVLHEVSEAFSYESTAQSFHVLKETGIEIKCKITFRSYMTLTQIPTVGN